MNFTWTEDYQKAFDDLRRYLSFPPLLMKLNIDDQLLMYLAVSSKAVSSILVQEENKMQKSIYYISRVLVGW